MSRESAYEFFRLVEQMRAAQKKYFKTKSQDAMIESMVLEKQVDTIIDTTNQNSTPRPLSLDMRKTKHNATTHLRVFEAFAGYGSQSMALRRLANECPGFSFEAVGISEIDRHAITAYRAVHGDIPNFGDISKIDWAGVPDFDLFTYSFPCQDISNAGHQRGFDEGTATRSSLLWECRRAIEAKLPRYLLMENVKALLQKKFKKEFRRWCEVLERLGYHNYTQVLNAKDYGVPQNRERVFMVSIRGEHRSYIFPAPFPLERRLRHILETEVDESYYLKPKQVEHIIMHCDRKVAEGCGFKTNFQTPEGISGAIKTKEGQREYDTYIAEPIIAALRGRDPDNPTSRRSRGKKLVQMLETGPDGLSNTLTSVDKDNLVLEPLNVCEDGTAPTITSSYAKVSHYDILAHQGTRYPAVLEQRPPQFTIAIPSDAEDNEIKDTEDGDTAKIIQLAQIYGNRENRPNPDRGRVVSGMGIAPSICASDYRDPLKIAEPTAPIIIHDPRKSYGKVSGGDIAPTILATDYKSPSLVVEPLNDQDGCSRTIKAQYARNSAANFIRQDSLGATAVIEHEDTRPVAFKLMPDGNIRAYNPDTPDKRGISEMMITNTDNEAPTLTSTHEPKIYGAATMYRIRKLTPRECFRLMDVTDEDIDKIQSATNSGKRPTPISKSQQYKLAGNSIVVAVLFYIFKKLFTEQAADFGQQLTFDFGL